MGIHFLRPTDYYAEMVKTDTHIEKIKGWILSEKRRIEEAEEKRKARDNKKKAKEVQAQKQKERVKQKKGHVVKQNQVLEKTNRKGAGKRRVENIGIRSMVLDERKV
nr:probable rRNA-processing protein EBP2 homolog [Tanacetum cinerariifolium]